MTRGRGRQRRHDPRGRRQLVSVHVGSDDAGVRAFGKPIGQIAGLVTAVPVASALCAPPVVVNAGPAAVLRAKLAAAMNTLSLNNFFAPHTGFWDNFANATGERLWRLYD